MSLENELAHPAIFCIIHGEWVNSDLKIRAKVQVLLHYKCNLYQLSIYIYISELEIKDLRSADSVLVSLI